MLDHAIALAGSFFEGFAIQYLHGTAHILNEPRIFEDAYRQRYAGTSGTEHLGKKFVGKRKQLRIDAILTHQQPARQALLNLMQPVASRKLGDLHPMHQSEAAEFRPQA